MRGRRLFWCKWQLLWLQLLHFERKLVGDSANRKCFSYRLINHPTNSTTVTTRMHHRDVSQCRMTKTNCDSCRGLSIQVFFLLFPRTVHERPAQKRATSCAIFSFSLIAFTPLTANRLSKKVKEKNQQHEFATTQHYNLISILGELNAVNLTPSHDDVQLIEQKPQKWREIWCRLESLNEGREQLCWEV